MDNLYAIILAGGTGTRLWPVSRQLAPKQLRPIRGKTTLLQDTVARLRALTAPDRMLFVTSGDFIYEIKKQVGDLLGTADADKCVFAAEKVGRNTAPAILLGALWVHSQDPEGLVIAAPSDHRILSAEAFHSVVENSIGAAREGYLVTYGIVPTRPETGYGYIKAGPAINSAFSVDRFEEKPSAERAEEIFAGSGYFWNSGIFFFSAISMVEEGRKYLPDVMDALEQVDPESFTGLDEAYRQIEPISIDHGIMERTDRAAVVPASMGWSDVGSWDSIYELEEKDEAGNVKSGNIVDLDTKGSLLIGTRRITAVAGLEDMIVVDTDDALLICRRGGSQDVRRITELLKSEGRQELVDHTTVRKPWGSFTVLDEGPSYTVKRLEIDPGQMLSLQSHRKRSEHWIVVDGTVNVTRGDETFTLKGNESTFIPANTKHRIENPGKSPLVIIEVWYGHGMSEDDIERFDDVYGRVDDD